MCSINLFIFAFTILWSNLVCQENEFCGLDAADLMRYYQMWTCYEPVLNKDNNQFYLHPTDRSEYEGLNYRETKPCKKNCNNVVECSNCRCAGETWPSDLNCNEGEFCGGIEARGAFGGYDIAWACYAATWNPSVKNFENYVFTGIRFIKKATYILK
ncbi:hypothetical protein HELRODRAFT_159897 [Helobdella robusta]|uniref:Uncharacterized protein n=1 Tax=Helobdella robusta TaxID=6412 RepID=T1EPI6_HELRO|nr:hypothetical protein HELRODRAFT_159897 [Helobdella robusta]ESO05821.1 hypothetical protein HELRODRAFT_159897 [Helobdella robusta]